jgi:hypothetical protein
LQQAARRVRSGITVYGIGADAVIPMKASGRDALIPR